MRFTGFLLLLLLAGLAGSGVYYMVLAKEGEPDPTLQDAALLFPQFGSLANDVTEIQLVSGQESLSVQKSGDKWSLAEFGGYGVKLNVIQKLALSVAELRIEEAKTAKPENHSLLGLQAPDVEGSKSKRLTFKNQAGEDLASMIIGNPKYRAGSEAVFVRREGEDQTWLCSGRIELPYSAKGWMDTSILKLDQERVASLRILHQDGTELNIERSSESPDRFDLTNVPLGRAVASEGNATSSATALSSLNFEEVQPVNAIDFESAPVVQSTYFFSDGLNMVLSAAEHEGSTWFKITAVLGNPTAESSEPTEAGAEAADPDAARAALSSEIAELNARLSPWAYKLPGFKLEQVAKPLEDLLGSLDTPGSNSTPDFKLDADGNLPAELQELLDSSPSGPPIPRIPPVKTPEAVETPQVGDQPADSPPILEEDGDDSED